MLLIRNNSYWIYRFNRLLSSCQSKNGKNLFSSSIALNSTMKKLFDSKQYKEALNLFDQNFEISTDSTIDMAIKACTISKDYKRGTHIQQRLSSKSRNNSYIQAALLCFYLECKDIDNAMYLFSSITNKSNYMYTVMFKGLIANNVAEKVFDLFDEMKIEPDQFTLNILFNACAVLNNNRAMKIGKKLLDEMPENYRNHNVMSTSAINMLMKFGDVESAKRIFRSIKVKDIITYNAMMKGYIENKTFEKALDLFEQIHLSLTNVTYTIVFNACAKLCNDRAMKIGKELLAKMPENYRNHNVISTSAINMLMKFGDIESAERIFRSIKTKNIITYNATMKGYIGNEIVDKALDLFEQIDVKLDDVTYIVVFNACAKLCNDRAMKMGKELLAKMPDNYRNHNGISTSAIDMLMKFGNVGSAEQMFRSIKTKGAGIYGALMNGYNLNGESWKCFKIFEEMNEKDIIPDEIEWNILIGACSKSGMLRHCHYIMNQIPLNIQNKIRIQNALVDMWGKCGSIEKAKNVFNLVVDRDTITYNSMINAFGLNGMGSQAVELYREMSNNLRDHISHICVLNACSHAGLLHEARTIFNEISLKPESIITTMV
ncbi:unnamed protein product [Rotaria socialis]|uniref:Pentatricopeptide repeat-containing protein n=1 Tax=Rotaria socialis TaxID=392032 RepID=A0A817YT81_9BILA|nr:unnamed protein product [Rotaria socialis]